MKFVKSTWCWITGKSGGRSNRTASGFEPQRVDTWRDVGEAGSTPAALVRFATYVQSFFVAVMLTASLAHAKPLRVCIPHDPTGDLSYEAIKRVTDQLTLDMKGEMPITWGCNSAPRVVQIIIGELSKRNAGRSEHMSPTRCVVRIFSEVDLNEWEDPTGEIEAYLRTVFLHEFAHCFGAPHSKRKTDIMFETVGLPGQETDRSYERYLQQLEVAKKNFMNRFVLRMEAFK